MPLYEYSCQKCRRKVSLFKPSIAEAESAATQLACDKCGSRQLQRIFSRFAVGKAALSEGEEIYKFDRLTAGMDDEPEQLEKWADSLNSIPED